MWLRWYSIAIGVSYGDDQYWRMYRLKQRMQAHKELQQAHPYCQSH
jgi:hypothetical protein